MTSNKSGWPIVAGHCAFAHGGLQVTNYACTLQFFDAENGAISVDAKMTTGSQGCGLIWRTGTGNGYAFVVVPDGSWAFFKITSGTGVELDSGSSAAINQGLGAVNSLWASFRGSDFVFVVNGVHVGESADPSYTGGIIGVVALGNSTAIFNNFAYYE